MSDFRQPVYRPEKDYIGEAFITLILYYIGFGFIGLIANIIFLRNARRDEVQGTFVRNKGCLQTLLWVHIALGVLGCIAAVVIMLLGGFAAIIDSGGF